MPAPTLPPPPAPRHPHAFPSRPLTPPPPPPPQGQAIYLVQEYCLTDLANVLRKSVTRPPQAVVKGVMVQLLRGLAALHEAGEASSTHARTHAGLASKAEVFRSHRQLASGICSHPTSFPRPASESAWKQQPLLWCGCGGGGGGGACMRTVQASCTAT